MAVINATTTMLFEADLSTNTTTNTTTSATTSMKGTSSSAGKIWQRAIAWYCDRWNRYESSGPSTNS